MKKWFQKSIIITVALLTFGLISPSHFIWEQILDTKSPPRAISSDVRVNYEQVYDYGYEESPDLIETYGSCCQRTSIHKVW